MSNWTPHGEYKGPMTDFESTAKTESKTVTKAEGVAALMKLWKNGMDYADQMTSRELFAAIVEIDRGDGDYEDNKHYLHAIDTVLTKRGIRLQHFNRTAGSTYVQISRDDLEAWLDTLPLAAKWYRHGNTAGVYLLPLSDSVAVKLNSTIGSADDAKSVGSASMQLALVSRVVIDPRWGPMVLNKKAQGQSHFARTTNWRDNWKEGVERMKDAYLKAQGFYDALAMVENRDRYRADLIARIEAVPDWRNHRILSDFHARVEQGGILSTAQVELLIKEEGHLPALSETSADTETLLARMRLLFTAAKKANDEWLVTFVTSLGKAVKSGTSLSEKQRGVLDRNFIRYGV